MIESNFPKFRKYTHIQKQIKLQTDKIRQENLRNVSTENRKYTNKERILKLQEKNKKNQKSHV